MDQRKPSRRWSSHEDTILRDAASKYEISSVDWQEVATHLEGRSNKDCRKRWVYALKIAVTKGPWGQDEDQRLKTAVETHGCRWNKVSKVVRTRQADQCSRRWHECLNPTINRSRWSLLEDSILECAVHIYGRNWTEIVERFFYDRTPIAARNRYNQRFQSGNRQMSLVEDEISAALSSTIGEKHDAEQLRLLLMAKQPDDALHSHLAEPCISPMAPRYEAAGDKLERSIQSPCVSSGFLPLDHGQTYSPTTSGDIHPGAAMPIHGNFSASHNLDEAAGALARITPLDVEAAFRELYTPHSPDHFRTNTYVAGSGNDFESLASSAPNPRSAMPASAPLSCPSATGELNLDGTQPTGSQSFDEMIRQVASYRVQAWGSSGR